MNFDESLSNENDEEHDIRTKLESKIAKLESKVAKGLEDVDCTFVESNPKEDLAEFIQLYKDDDCWDGLKKSLLSKRELEILEVLRGFLAGEIDGFEEGEEWDLYRWTDFKHGKYGRYTPMNKYFSPLLNLFEDSYFVCDFSGHFPKFADMSKNKQLAILSELFCNLIFYDHLSIFTRAVENYVEGSDCHDTFAIEGLLPSKQRRYLRPHLNVEKLALGMVFQGYDDAKGCHRVKLTKYELAGFYALFCFGECVFYSYEHYCYQKTIKTKFNKKAAMLEDSAVYSLIRGQSSCQKALHGVALNIFEKNKQKADEERVKLNSRSSKGGQMTAHLPDEYWEVFKSTLKYILEYDEAKILRVSDVAGILTEYMNQSGKHKFECEDKYVRANSWCKDEIIKLGSPDYLSKRGAPTKLKRVLINEIKELLGVEYLK